MRLLITGGTGLIGCHLIPFLAEYYQITALTRNVAMADYVISHRIKLISSLSSFENLDDFDVVINLAGEPLVGERWNNAQKEKIKHSRWDLTANLVSLIKAGHNPPAVFISGSAIGYYGRQGEQEIDEDFDKPKDEFSHQLCEKWEEIALQVSSPRTRVCILRTGIVLSKHGGALDKMVPPFKLGVGGPMASGKQYMSWIHMHDMLTGIMHLLHNESCTGIYNFTAPNPVTNGEFSQTLAEILHRPCMVRTPAFVLKLLLGEMSDLLIFGQRVVPKRLLQSGFEFKHPDLEESLLSLHL
jgi:uncharacterized protein (TIGR01777 family)